MDHRAHQPFADIIAGIIILTREILLTDMVKNIIDAGCHLVMGQRQRIDRIKNREFRHNLLICKYMTDFLMGMGIGDHRAGIHF